MAFSPGFPSRGRIRGRLPENKDEHRLNERIRVPQVRLIDDEGNQVGVVPTEQALQMARNKGLDLMEISPNSKPPVCKILDYGKFKYEKKKKEHAAKKKQTVVKVKEVQFRPRTDQHDLDFKFNNARSFLEEGAKVKVNMLFRGREVAYSRNGYEVMNKLAESVQDIAQVEAPPKMEGRKMIMILAPLAGGKKPADKAKKAGDSVKKAEGGPTIIKTSGERVS